MSTWTPSNLKDLQALIAKAKREGKWLRCGYQGLWFSPKELTEANEKGRFLWGVVNWELCDPMDKIKGLEKNKARIDIEIAEMRERIL